MTAADFINRITHTFPGIEFVFFKEVEGEFRAIVKHAFHAYVISGTDRFYVAEEFGSRRDITSFSRRIEGMLNGWKRNDAGEMVNPSTS